MERSSMIIEANWKLILKKRLQNNLKIKKKNYTQNKKNIIIKKLKNVQSKI